MARPDRSAHPDPVSNQIALLHVYHLDLWTEMEAQMRVLRVAQEEIAKLRESRTTDEKKGAALYSAAILQQHVQTLKGRIQALSNTATELEVAVAALVRLLSTSAK
jgi:hypothetical protein